MRALRWRLGWTQEDLAERAAIARVEVSNLESGRNQARSARIHASLASAFRVPVELISVGLAGGPGEKGEQIDAVIAATTLEVPARRDGAPRPPRRLRKSTPRQEAA